MNTIDRDAIRKRIANCRTYNFGMRDADTLAHEDAPAMLEILDAQTGSPHVDAKHWRQLQEARAALEAAEGKLARIADVVAVRVHDPYPTAQQNHHRVCDVRNIITDGTKEQR